MNWSLKRDQNALPETQTLSPAAGFPHRPEVASFFLRTNVASINESDRSVKSNNKKKELYYHLEDEKNPLMHSN